MTIKYETITQRLFVTPCPHGFMAKCANGKKTIAGVGSIACARCEYCRGLFGGDEVDCSFEPEKKGE